MKVFLLHRDGDFDVRPELRDDIYDALFSPNPFAVTAARRDREHGGTDVKASTDYDELTQDLELRTLWRAMAAGDDCIHETVRLGMLSSLHDPQAIVYRQGVLGDCLEQEQIVRDMYALAIEALEAERTVGGIWHNDRPSRVLSRSVQVLRLHLGVLTRLRAIADERAGAFGSQGFARFFAMLADELSDDYLDAVKTRLDELEFKRGVLLSAELGKGNKARQYTVRRGRELRWTQRLPFASRPESYSFTIPARDDSGWQALEDIRDKGINHVADAVGQAADHVKAFFSMLRVELAFYLGCVNLHRRLEEKGEPTCFPEPLAPGRRTLTADSLYDPSLALHIDERVVGNDVPAEGKSLVIITGANQGGKSTLLRGVGIAQLMMQSGMFVAARALRATVSSGVFTHYKREEDAAMRGGKLDEELHRMSDIADRILPGSLLLCNESFASTNEREGSEIARRVVRAMLDRGVDVVFVTHMYDLAHGFFIERLDAALFLRAERTPDGGRTFKLAQGEPLSTSFGADSYRRIFGVPADAPSP
jgi:hypothetical protein